MNKQKTKSVFNRGGWKMLLCALLLAAVVLSGMLFDALGSAGHVDLTAGNAFTLSDTTKELLGSLTGDISVLVVADSDSADARLEELAGRYAAESANVTAKLITPEQALYYAGAELTPGDVIVTNGEYDVVLDYTELYEMQYEVQGYYQTLTDFSFAAEDRINRAIANINADLPMAYALAGHGETPLELGVESILSKTGYHTKSLYLSELKSIPEDCAMILCNAPQLDLTAQEADQIIEFIDNGGSFILVTDMKYPFGTELGRVTEHVGLAMESGIVVEGDAAYMFGADYPYYLLPAVKAGEMADEAPETGVPSQALIALSHSIKLTGGEGYTTSSLMETSASAFIKPNAYADGVIEYAEGDAFGPFTIAAVSENEAGGKVFWLGSSQCLGDAIDEMVGGANYAVAGMVVNWMHGDRDTPAVAEVEAVSVMSPAIVMDSPALFICACAALPALILLFGVILYAKRHSKGKIKGE